MPPPWYPGIGDCCRDSRVDLRASVKSDLLKGSQEVISSRSTVLAVLRELREASGESQKTKVEVVSL